MNKLIVELMVISGVMLVTACGGGGGGGGSSTNSGSATPATTVENEVVASEVLGANEYQPDESLLNSDAETSEDLYVRNDFRFTGYKTVVFNFTAVAQNNDAISNALIKVSSLPDDVDDLNDERLSYRELLSVIKTDNNGQVYQTLELPQNVTSVLVELNAIGVENAVILSVEGVDVVAHNFL